MNRTFRVRRALLYVDAATVLVLLAVAVAFGRAISTGTQDMPPAAAWAVLGSLLAFTGLAVGVLVSVVCHRLRVTETSVEAPRRTPVPLAAVLEARWRLSGAAGHLVLRTRDQTLKVHFDYYSAEERRALVRFFRRTIPEALQRDWERFWRQYWPIFDEPDASRSREAREETRAMRWRLHLIFFAGTLFIVPTGVGLAWYTGAPQLIVLALLVPAMWPMAFFVRHEPRKIGSRRPRPGYPVLVAIGFLWLTLGFIVSLVCIALDLSVGRVIFSVNFTGSMALMLIGAVQFSRRVERWRDEAARLAADEYLSAGNRTSSDE